MILGYMISSTGGTPLIIKEFSPLLNKDFSEFATSTVTAIQHIAEKVFDSSINTVELDKYVVYLFKKNDLIISIFSDGFDETVNDVAKKIENLIEESLNVTKFSIVDEENLSSLEEKIDEIIFSKPPSIATVRNLAMQVLAMIPLEMKSKELPVKTLKPKELKRNKLMELFFGTVEKKTIEELFDLFYKEKLEDVIRYAPALFDTDNGDLARILYLISGIFLNTYDPEKKAPKLDELFTIAEQINDPLARELILIDLNGFLELGTYHKKRVVIIRNRKEIFKVLSENSPKSVLYAILIHPTPDQILNKIQIALVKDKSAFLTSLFEEARLLMEILLIPLRDVEKWLEVFSGISKKYDEFKNQDTQAKYSYLHMYFFSRVWGLTLPNITFNEGKTILEEGLKLWDAEGYKTIVKKARATIRHKSVNAYFALNYIFKIMLEIWPEDEKSRQLDEKEQQLLNLISWLRAVGDTHREILDMYFTSVAALVAALSRVLQEKNILSKDILKMVDSLSRDEMQEFWHYNDYHFAHYYFDLLDAVGNVALFLSDGQIKQNILFKIAFAMEQVFKKFERNSLMKVIFLPNIIRYYTLSGTQRAIKNRDTLLDEHVAKASPFVQELINKIVQNIEQDQRIN